MLLLALLVDWSRGRRYWEGGAIRAHNEEALHGGRGVVTLSGSSGTEGSIQYHGCICFGASRSCSQCECQLILVSLVGRVVDSCEYSSGDGELLNNFNEQFMLAHKE